MNTQTIELPQRPSLLDSDILSGDIENNMGAMDPNGGGGLFAIQPGMREPEGVVFAGNMRLDAARRLGWITG
jgi:hypothetical protein